MRLPEDFIVRMKQLLGKEADSFFNCLLSESPHSSFRINTSKPDALSLIEKEFGKSEQIEWCPDGYYTNKERINGNHPYHLAGLFYFQEPSAMLSVEALPIEPDDFVLDLCAAPGGKSTQAAAKLTGNGILVANEIIPRRAAILSENIERMGFSNTIVTNESPSRLALKYPHFFDKIIIDAPCSGEGMFRKEPQAITEWSTEHTVSCSARQKNILDSALLMLAPGGYVVYSTCTFAPIENEENVKYILDNYPDMRLLDIPAAVSDGLIENTKRIYPHRSKGEGHFTALFKSNSLHTSRVLKEHKSSISEESMKLIEDFFEKHMNITPSGNLIPFGDRIYRMPGCIDISGIKVLRAGLYMGDCKKGRFEPSHALCLALKRESFKHTLDFPPDSPELFRYLRGETLPCAENGWICVTVSGVPMGWGKASAGILKNHYPKALRLLR